MAHCATVALHPSLCPRRRVIRRRSFGRTVHLVGEFPNPYRNRVPGVLGSSSNGLVAGRALYGINAGTA